MHYLKPALELAERRGLLTPRIIAIEAQLPSWFRKLGTDAGLAEFEALRGIRVPAALCEFYGCAPLACFLESAIDGEVLLTDLADCLDEEIPPIVNWSGCPHLVFSFHNHSGMVAAARIGQDDPTIYFGFDHETDPIPRREIGPVTFSQWVHDIVDGYKLPN